MKMSPREIFALRDYLDPGLKGRTLSDARHSASLTDISDQTCLKGRLADLSGRSVLLAVSSQFLASLVMLEIDGIARRMLLCPPDLNTDHLQALIEDAEIDAVVTDQPERFASLGIALVVAASEELHAAPRAQTERATEWLVLTPGTLGLPKIVGPPLEGLTGAIAADGPARGSRPIWATFYDIRRYGGLQIFFRAGIGGGCLVVLGAGRGGVEVKGGGGFLLIPPRRAAHAYVGRRAGALTDEEGFVDTGDMVELRGDRYHFVGRRGGILNIGGLKVHPEEIEAVINRDDAVRMSRVKARKSPITGAIVIADVVLADGFDANQSNDIKNRIIADCRENLAPHKVPAMIKFVERLEITAAGKLARSDA